MNPLTAIRAYAPAALRPEGAAGLTAPMRPVPIRELQELPGLNPAQRTGVDTVKPGSFGQMMGQMVGEISAKQDAAGAALTGLLSGENVSLHQAMIAMEEASVSFQLMVEVRNKLLESYQELMRMQV